MPKGKKSNNNSLDQLFKTHDNLKWLLPLFLVVVLGFVFIARHSIQDNDPSGDHSAVIKQEIKQGVKDKLQIDNDNETMDDQNTSDTPADK